MPAKPTQAVSNQDEFGTNLETGDQAMPPSNEFEMNLESGDQAKPPGDDEFSVRLEKGD